MPVVADGDLGVHAVDLHQVAELLNIPYENTPVLSPDELIEKTVQALSLLRAQIADIPDSTLPVTLPGRDRTIESLINHTVEIAVNFLDVSSGDPFDESRANAEPESNLNPSDLSVRIDAVLQRLGSLKVDFSTPIDTYYGKQTLHSVLERCAWHCVQHLRQLEFIMSKCGIQLSSRVTEKLMADLPIPKDVWG